MTKQEIEKEIRRRRDKRAEWEKAYEEVMDTWDDVNNMLHALVASIENLSGDCTLRIILITFC